ncbi:neuroendocrine convertase 1-like [Watersipora subatra]|uniref:neuroendocrine convertase 1-like n=1 Tax=Watersipora subatra TaxID=2589382 RepID=UPI00355B2130
MKIPWKLLVVFLVELLACEAHDKSGHYLNQFVIEVQGGVVEARKLATELGFTYHEKLNFLDDHYVFTHKDVRERHKRAARFHARLLANHQKVLWFEQQTAKVREKRSSLSKELTPNERATESEAYQRLGKSFNDPMWTSSKQDWYMYDHKKTPSNDTKTVKTDLGILPAWDKGYTGKGVVISILDDGLEWNHTDIQENYAPHASYDLNDDDDDPFPRYDFTNENKHGTRCAGVIAMVANNNWCGVGIAPHAKVGGVRMLDGPISDVIESKAVSFNVKNIDIMSASWGPSDNGRMVDGPGKLGNVAFEKGITEGRHGRGIIYVWASGNGGHRGDNCECDGYVSSPYTISVSAVSTSMRSPYYVERCPSTMATTFSSGAVTDSQIVSADLHNLCTQYFSGTSASAPQGAGIVALVLQANPMLNWRDVQHIIVWTASPYPLYNEKGWRTNAAGFKVNHRFGFGLMNAIDMVEQAEKWVNVGERIKCEINITDSLPREISRNKAANIKIEVTESDCGINYLEHVELVMTASYSKRGDLSLDLTSAQGSRVSMMRPRDNDFNNIGYIQWPFMSIQTWGEKPHGEWQLHVWDDKSITEDDRHGQVLQVTLRIFGTKEMPHVMKTAKGHRRSYNFQLQDIIKKKFPTKDISGELLGDVAGWLNIG